MGGAAGGRISSKIQALVVGVCALFLVGGVLADEEQGSRDYDWDIPAQDLNAALQAVALSSNHKLLYKSELAEGKRSPAVKGSYSVREAVEALLAGTDLAFEITPAAVVLIRDAKSVAASAAAAEDAGGDSDSGNGRTAGATPIVMAQKRTATHQSQASQPNKKENERAKRPIEEIIVTGTHIRGIAPESSPVRTFTREDIQISGAGTAQDFIQTQTFNFGGGSNEVLSGGLPNDDSVQMNTPGRGALGSSVNLRGLGSGGTLVLLNGHRLAPSSGIGDFVDISMIPASALERVEVLTDGASSIYGGDAIAGVINFILRDDYDGVETSLRYGTVTAGDLNEYRVSITGGKNWDSGNALVVGEYYKRDDLSAGDKPFSRDATTLPYDLLPSQERHSVLATASQEILPNLKLDADVIFSERDAVQDRTSLLDGDQTRGKPSSSIVGVFAGVEWRISNTWFVDFSGTHSDVHMDAIVIGDVENTRENDSDIWTGELKTSGTFAQIPGGHIKLAVGGHYREEAFSAFNILRDSFERNTNRETYAFFGEMFVPVFGPDNAVPGIKRLELNVSGRSDHYSDFGSTANPKVGVLWAPTDSLRFRGSYSTSFNPPPLGRVGATDRFVGVYPSALLNSTFGSTPADASIADVIELVVSGTDKDLESENSRAYTAGVDFDEQWNGHHLNFSITWFDIEFENRLGRAPCPGCAGGSALDAPNVAFNNPDAFPEGSVIFSPSLDQINDVLDSADILFTALGDPLDAEIINFAAVTRNLSRTLTNGFDLDITYSLESGSGNYLLGLNGTYLTEFKQQGSIVTPLVERLNTLYNPVDLRLRGHAGYERDGFTANLFVNYANDYREDNTADAARVDSWTTVDISVSYDTGEELNSSILEKVFLRLSVRNLLDELPPSAPINPNFGLIGFDPTNASPLGRFIAFDVTKRF